MLTTRTMRRLGLTLASLLTWLVVLLRIQPWPFSDYGVFVAVARRLNAGYVLYAGVWDNKDPFVYYSLALVQNLGQPALWLLEAWWFVLASLAAYAMARHYGLSQRWSYYIGSILVPIALIPFDYFPGTTHLAGIALSLAAVATFQHSRYGLSGVAIGFLIFFKLSMLPLALVPMGVLVLRQQRLRSLVPTGLAAVITVAIGAVVITIRGELGPYLGSLAHNFTYSQTNTESGSMGAVAIASERISVLTDLHVLVAIVVLAAVLAVTFTRAWRSEPWQLASSTYVTALISILAIGKFPHHAQVIGVSAVLALITLVRAFDRLREARPLFTAGLALLVAVGLTGGPSIKGYRDALRNPQGTWTSMTTADTATTDLVASGPPQTFAIVQGAEMPRSPGLEEWNLVCRHLAQRPWESAELLQESIDCFPRAEVLLLPRDFQVATAPPAFREFTEQVAHLVAENYTCTETSRHLVCSRLDDADY